MDCIARDKNVSGAKFLRDQAVTGIPVHRRDHFKRNIAADGAVDQRCRVSAVTTVGHRKVEKEQPVAIDMDQQGTHILHVHPVLPGPAFGQPIGFVIHTKIRRVHRPAHHRAHNAGPALQLDTK